MDSSSQDEYTQDHPVDSSDTQVVLDENTRAIGAALGGDKPALRNLVDRLTPVIQSRVARALLRRQSQASGRTVRQELEDFVQEVFVSLFAGDGRILRSWRHDGGLSLENFVGLIADRQVATILRTGKRNPWKEDPTLDEGLEKIVDNQEQSQASGMIGTQRSYKVEGRVASKEVLERLWQRLVEELSPRGRNIFMMLYLQEFSVEEVCRKLGLSPEAVYTWRSRLMRLSRRLMDEIMSENGSKTRRS